MTSTVSPSNGIIVSLAIELPYWIPIKSGKYTLQNGRAIKVRNDLWMISTGNIIDDSVDPPSDFIVNEEQVTDKAVLENRARGQARYFHKRKMNTTFTRYHPDILPEPLLTATTPSAEWRGQLHNVVFGTLQDQSILDEFLKDANLFIDLYSTIISPQNPSREVRSVSFYETLIHLRIVCRTEHFHFEDLSRISPDWKMAGQPYPPSRVGTHKDLKVFKDTIVSCSPPEFHQLEWIKTLNFGREKRYQEALLHATITLEALAHIYLSAKGISSRKKRKKVINAEGLADWLLGLNIKGLTDECENVAELRKLRNDVVHREKILTEEDIELIKSGIQSLAHVRVFLLQSGKPEILELENKFISFLEHVELGKASSDSIGQMIQMKFGWRKEKDCYQVN